MVIRRTTHRPHNPRGFTLIEVLVVVAIIALLISILLPSLKQARELARLTVCATHQKNIGNGMTMYFQDNKDVMPGPIHPMFLVHPDQMVSGPVDTPQKKFVVSGYVNTRLRKYMGDKTFGKGQNMKDVGMDPSFPLADKQFGNIPVYHFAINSSDVTAPWLYFGFTHGGVSDQHSWDLQYGGMDATTGKITDPAKRNHFSPKPLGRIFSGTGPTNSSGVMANWRNSPGKEWLIADAFRRPLRAKQCGTWPTADEPGNEKFSDIPNPVWKENDQWGSLSNYVHGSGDSASAKVAPFHPYHIGGGYKVKKDSTGASTGETTYAGKVDTLYFDGHVAAQEGWKGTVFERRMLPGTQVTVRD